MADKKRVFKLAEEIKVEALEIIAYLKSEGVDGISAASYVDGERVQDIKDHFSGKKTKAKKSPKTAEAKVETKVAAKEKEGAGPAEAPKVGVTETQAASTLKEAEAKAPGAAKAAPSVEEKLKEVAAKDAALAKEPTLTAKDAALGAKESSKELVKEAPKEAPKSPEVKFVPLKPASAPDITSRPKPLTPSSLQPRAPAQGFSASSGVISRPSAPIHRLPTSATRIPGAFKDQGGFTKRSVAPGAATPTETIRQHISSKFGGIKPRPFPSRPAPQGAPPARLGGLRPRGAMTPAIPDVIPTPARDHRGAGAKGRASYRAHTPQEGRQEGKRIGFGKATISPISKPVPFQPLPITKSITLTEGVSVKELAEKLDIKAKDIIKRLLDKGMFATMNQTLDETLAIELSKDFGAEASIISFEEDAEYEAIAEEKTENVTPRPPVVTIMGHVDHGKTSLLDAIRETSVTSTEAGGITQHIGAYQVEKNGRTITFLDTPGHEAFTMMRARGAKVTDVVVLVVAADDGVMPQTLEAIAHARAAKVPIVVAINKIDKPNAHVERVKKTLSENGLLAEDWGGDTVTVEVSAKQRTNLDLLQEMILLVSDLQGLKANIQRAAMGTILEAKLDKGRGPVATVLVQNGTLNVSDSFIVGAVTGKVRAMFDHLGKMIKSAGPSTPVEVLGLQAVPQAGDLFQVLTDITKVKQIGTLRQLKLRESQLSKTARLTLEHFHEQLKAGAIKELPLIIKADVQGSVEVLSESLSKLGKDKVKVKIIHRGTGAITESDVLLASASNAIIIGFNVRPEKKAPDLAQHEGVDIRLHTIIYNITNEIKAAMTGMLDPQFKEAYQGTAEVRDTFKVPKFGIVAGSYITDGKVTRNSQARLLRDNVVVYEGKIASLRRFKDDAAEVRSGFECGIGLENFHDVKVGDVIETFFMEKMAAETL